MNADHGALGDILVLGDDLFHLAGRQAVAGDVDDVVGARHDVGVAVGVDEAGVGGRVVAREVDEVARAEALVVVPQRRQAAGRQRQLDGERARSAGRHGLALVVQHLQVVARQRHRRRAVLDGELTQTDRVAADGPARLGLPPVVDHRHLELCLGPLDGLGVGALAGQEQGAQALQIVLPDELALRILFLDGAEGGRRGEQRRDVVLRDDAPEGTCVGRADWLALVDQRGRAVQQGPVADVGVTDHPAHVGGGPEHLARLDAVEVLHGPLEGDHVAAVVAHDALGLAGGARSVENVERVGGGDRDAARLAAARAAVGTGGAPVEVAALLQGCDRHRALQDQRRGRLVLAELDRLVEQGLVGDDLAALDAARSGHDADRLGVVDAGRKFAGGETAEHDGMHRADAGAGQHAHHRFRDHRHVEDDAVALLDAEVEQHAGERGHFVGELGVGVGAGRVGDGAVVDQRRQATAAVLDVAVEAVVGGVALGAREPAAVQTGVGIDHLVPELVPGDVTGGVGPEPFRVLFPRGVDLVIATHRFPPMRHTTRLRCAGSPDF